MVSRILSRASTQAPQASADPGHLTAIQTKLTAAAQSTRVVALEEGNKASPIALAPRENLALELYTNGTTGYQWYIEANLPKPVKTCVTPPSPHQGSPLHKGDNIFGMHMYGGKSEAYHYTWRAQDLPSDGKPFKVNVEQRRSNYSGVRNACIRHTEFTFVRPKASWLASFIDSRRR